jgi:L-seryl-tRNA(Ser) seleniumtransferase
MAAFRHIPSIDVLLQQPAIAARAARQGHAPVVESLRAAADAWRTLAKADAAPPGDPAVWIAERAMEALETSLAASLRPVINATGVIIHTNLGRAPLANAAVARAMEVARGYANLEYDLEAGARGHRHVHAERLLCALTGAEAAIVANNNAAGT